MGHRRRISPAKAQRREVRKDYRWKNFTSTKLLPDGAVSTVGLFYSQPEAQKIVDMLRANPDRAGYRYEIVEAVRPCVVDKGRSAVSMARQGEQFIIELYHNNML